MVLAPAVNVARVAAAGAPLPAPPPGYTWVSVDALNAAFLRPRGWRVVGSQGKLLGSVAIVRDRPPPGRRFATGLTAYAIDRLSRSAAVPLSRQIDEFARTLQRAPAHVVHARRPVARGALRGVALRYRDLTGSDEKIVERLYLGDERADRLLIVSFEAPARPRPSLRPALRS